MTLLNNILLAVEESPAPVEMVKALLQLPSSRGATITLLHAVKGLSSAEQQQQELARGRDLLAKCLDQLSAVNTESAFQIKTILRSGDPKDVVCNVAEEIKASLLIMGSRGLNNIIAILSNSVSQYVFQRAVCPTLLLRDGTYVTRIKRIAVAVSDTMAAKYALQTALDLIRFIPDGEILLLRVRTRPLTQGEEGRLVNPEEESLILATAAEAVRQQGVKYRALYGVGNPGTEICRLAQENYADLLIVGCEDRRPSIARNLPDLDRLLGNSVSDYIRTHSPCPVLLQKTAV
jgi:nucleotide-binding universal stress UspA family protein